MTSRDIDYEALIMSPSPRTTPTMHELPPEELAACRALADDQANWITFNGMRTAHAYGQPQTFATSACGRVVLEANHWDLVTPGEPGVRCCKLCQRYIDSIYNTLVYQSMQAPPPAGDQP